MIQPVGLQQNADRLGRTVVVVSSWRPKGRHPRLWLISAPQGVDGRPAPAMTMKARPQPVSTCLRFAIGMVLSQHDDVIPVVYAANRCLSGHVVHLDDGAAACLMWFRE
jgi:hypothetical protein